MLSAILLILSMIFNFLVHCIKINNMNVSFKDQHVELKTKYFNFSDHIIFQDWSTIIDDIM